MATNRQAAQCGNWKCFSAQGKKFINLDHIFYRLGLFLGTHPLKSICVSLLLCILSGIGLLLWHEELSDVELFMPPGSHVRSDAAWVQEHFQDGLRFESVIVEADNVLEPSVLAAIAELEVAVKKINVSGHHWEDVCARYQSWFQDSDEPLNASAWTEFLDDVNIDTFPNDCIYQSLLKLWSFNGNLNLVFSLKQHDILKTITRYINESKPKNILEDVEPLMSGLQWSPEGRVKGAKATILNWMLKKSDNSSADWELEFIHQALFSNRSLPNGVKIYAVSTRRSTYLCWECQ